MCSVLHTDKLKVLLLSVFIMNAIKHIYILISASLQLVDKYCPVLVAPAVVGFSQTAQFLSCCVMFDSIITLHTEDKQSVEAAEGNTAPQDAR